MADAIGRLRDFARGMTAVVERAGGDEARIFAEGAPLLKALVSVDDWLPETYAKPHPEHYEQYLLYCDLQERFSVVSFVWGPGQKTPVHDHTVWGMIGMLRGSETCRGYAFKDGHLATGAFERLQPGDVATVSPRVGDIHEVANAFADRTSVSIHVYGANIGAVRRHVFDAATGAPKDFVSGYSSAFVPNLWDRSAAIRAAIS